MNEIMKNAMFGALVADAISMPVHWYYDTNALDRDYPNLDDGYRAPKNPHPDSILWRSKYTPRNKDADILHQQAVFWGQRGVHYHQFLPAGGNTLNFLLGVELYRLVVASEGYCPKAWLQRYVDYMRRPDSHSDTYAEEYHRAFFDNLSRGRQPEECGIEDIHIGGLTPVPFLLAALDTLAETVMENELDLLQSHLALTHLGQPIASTGRAFAKILRSVAGGNDLRDAIIEHGNSFVNKAELETWSRFEDRVVVGRHLTTACYLPESFIASLYLAWKYHDDFSAGVVANARCGGDNAHRGAVVGALLGAANSVPWRWLHELKSMERLHCDTPLPVEP
ncbi:MAG: ADP-ribosylglycohydrolase family protein [Verrucomicrobiota bacterium]